MSDLPNKRLLENESVQDIKKVKIDSDVESKSSDESTENLPTIDNGVSSTTAKTEQDATETAKETETKPKVSRDLKEAQDVLSKDNDTVTTASGKKYAFGGHLFQLNASSFGAKETENDEQKNGAKTENKEIEKPKVTASSTTSTFGASSSFGSSFGSSSGGFGSGFGSSSKFGNAFQQSLKKKSFLDDDAEDTKQEQKQKEEDKEKPIEETKNEGEDEEKEESGEENAAEKSQSSDQYKQIELNKIDTKTGEEGEKSLFNTNTKLFELNLSKISEGWKERGLGPLHLNQSITNKQQIRLVMRSQGLLRVILNMKITKDTTLMKGLEASLSPGKYLRFNSINDEGIPLQYLLKFGQETTRNTLYDRVEELKKNL